MAVACTSPPRTTAIIETSAPAGQRSSSQTGPGRAKVIGERGQGSLPADSEGENSKLTGKIVSGLYVSEITSVDSGKAKIFARKHESLVLYFDRQEDRLTVTDIDDNTIIEAVQQGEVIHFNLLPGSGKGSMQISGRWFIEDDGARLEGTWRDEESHQGGEWNLRRRDNSGVELYTTRTGFNRPFRIGESEELFDLIFSPPNTRNVVFYVHGRSGDFETEFDPSMIPYTEASSNTRFVIIHWLSWSKSRIRPYWQARDSSRGLSDFLFAFDEYKRRKPGYTSGRNITLLAHSMGNIPLKVFVEEIYRPGALQEGLLGSVILSGADVPVVGHRNWVEKIDFSNRINIIQNRGDLVLSLSDLIDADTPGGYSPKLGRGFGAETYTHFNDLAKNASYLDVTRATGIGHRAFNMSSYAGDENATRLFSLLLNGQGFEVQDPAIGLYRNTDLSPVFYFFGSRGPLDETPVEATESRAELIAGYIESRANQIYSEEDRRPDRVKRNTGENDFIRSGDWKPARGEWRTTWGTTNASLKIIDDTRVTYDYRNGRIFFYSIDEHGRWDGYWVEDKGGRGCGNVLKDGSKYWGRVSFRFNPEYTRFEGTWDYCGVGKKTHWEGVR